MRMRSLLVGLGTLAILLVVLGWIDRPGPADASRDTPVPERLSVTVNNDRTHAREGQVITYTTRVRNNEPRAYRVEVTQMLPSALRVVRSSGDARVGKGEVVWQVTVPPGQERVVRATTQVGASREGYSRLVTTSCLALRGEAPVACARDTDALTVTSTAAPSAGRLFSVMGIGLVVALGAVAAYAVGRGTPSGGAVGVPVGASPASLGRPVRSALRAGNGRSGAMAGRSRRMAPAGIAPGRTYRGHAHRGSTYRGHAHRGPAVRPDRVGGAGCQDHLAPLGRGGRAGRTNRAGRAADPLRAWTARVLESLAALHGLSTLAGGRRLRGPASGLARIRDQVRLDVTSLRWAPARGPPRGTPLLLVHCCLEA